MAGEFNYCQRCGERLGEKHIEGMLRPYCPACEYVVFLDPKVAAVALVVDGEGLVMVKRGVEPEYGKWAFPSGYVDRGEVVKAAAVREVKEETGLDVALDRLIGVYSLEGNPVVLVVYSAHIIGGEVVTGHDALDVKTFALAELPSLPFPHDEQILRDWLDDPN
jgi:ADP-ribose pyrophosphatase YjhB (NUDIX family)